MPLQAPQWTEFLSCPGCLNVFNDEHYQPISLACGHSICRSCLTKFQQQKCPFDQTIINNDVGELPVNFALLQLVAPTAVREGVPGAVPEESVTFYLAAIKYVEELALLLKPVSSASTGSIITPTTTPSQLGCSPNCVLSRPLQRKLITLINCQMVESEGRSRAVRAARSLGERTVTELILHHQNPQQLSSNLWAAVRGRGCQFLGPAMQEEVLRLILLALEDGSALSRKVLVLFVVQRLEAQYPQASKTAIGHVVQLLYRASCFKVTKRDEESSLMQVKEEYRTYDLLRREHDTQVVQIAMEAGLRIAPDQWSSLLYGDATHKSHMQSIIDKLQTPQTFGASVIELLIALQRTGDPHRLQRLQPQLEFLSSIDPNPDVPCPSWENLEGIMKAAETVVEGLVDFLENSGHKKHDFLTPFNVRYKTSMCRDFLEKSYCPRGPSCTFAHSEDELERYRQRNKKAGKGVVGVLSPKKEELPDPRLDLESQRRQSIDKDDPIVKSFKSLNLNNQKSVAGGYSPTVATVAPTPKTLTPGTDHPPLTPAPRTVTSAEAVQAPQCRVTEVAPPSLLPNMADITNLVPPFRAGAPPMLPTMQIPFMKPPTMLPTFPGITVPPPDTIDSSGEKCPVPVNPFLYACYPSGMPHMPMPCGFVPPTNCQQGRLNPFAEPWQPILPQPLPQQPLPQGGQMQQPYLADCSMCPKQQFTNQQQQQQAQPACVRPRVTCAPVSPVAGAPPYEMPTSQAPMTHLSFNHAGTPIQQSTTTSSRQTSIPITSTIADINPVVMPSARQYMQSLALTISSNDNAGTVVPSPSQFMRSVDSMVSSDGNPIVLLPPTAQYMRSMSSTVSYDSNPVSVVPSASQYMRLMPSPVLLEGSPADTLSSQPMTVSNVQSHRQSLRSLKLRRHSLMTQLQDHNLTAGKRQDPPTQVYDGTCNADRRSFSDSISCEMMPLGEQQTADNILDHPEPSTIKPFGLKTEINQRLGAISGIRPCPVNDSIIASWMTASLPASDRNTSYESKFRNAYQDVPLQWSDVSDDEGSTTQESFINEDGGTFATTDIDDDDAEMMASGTAIESMTEVAQIQSQEKLTNDAFPFLNDVTQALESPTPTPPPTDHACSPELSQGDLIPFFPPLFSKFGPISRTAKSKYKDSVPLKVTADEMMKTAPVTAVTPLSQPPLMNANPVPSRFTNILDGSPGGETVAKQLTCPQYCLWENHVNVLEMIAQQASTKDERLSVELLAVDLQISMKQQELQQCADLQKAQRQASEYMRRQQIRDDKIEQGQDTLPKSSY